MIGAYTRIPVMRITHQMPTIIYCCMNVLLTNLNFAPSYTGSAEGGKISRSFAR